MPVDVESPAPPTDEEIVARVLGGERELYELLMRRHNQRLFRTARAIVRDPSEAEDIMQEAYVRAYANLAQFAGGAAFATWLTRICVHEALGRLRRRSRWTMVTTLLDSGIARVASVFGSNDPERAAIDSQTKALLEDLIDELPEIYRTVFVLRCVEGLSAAETADCLTITEQAAKMRLHRARALLRIRIKQKIGSATPEIFGFHAVRCDRVVAAVMARIG